MPRTLSTVGGHRLRPALRLLAGIVVSLAVSPAVAVERTVLPLASSAMADARLAQAEPGTVPAISAPPTMTPEEAFELSFWESIKNSNNPDDYRAYLETYPNGRYAALARVRASQGPRPPADPATPQPQPAQPSPPVQPVISPIDSNETVTQHAIIRATPDPNGQRIGTVEKGEKIRVTGRVEPGNWLRVLAKSGRTGFLPADDLKPAATPQTAPPTPNGPTAVANPEMPGVVDCPDCPSMKPINPGSFDMGSSEFYEFEKPVHKVSIRPFLMGQFEVTVGQWRICVADNACKARGAADADANLPITDVSWTEANAYTTWLSARTGKRYRLPSEAEWEYAMRAGTTTSYYWGRSLIRGRANCVGCSDDFNRRAVAVGRFPPNDFGLYDMAGNAAEWVQDCWSDNYRGAPTDGSALERAQCPERVLRGGSFINDPRYLRSAARFKYDADVHYYGNGFRVARDQ